jgi:uncharacterized protein YfiM (DUF2279 family)
MSECPLRALFLIAAVCGLFTPLASAQAGFETAHVHLLQDREEVRLVILYGLDEADTLVVRTVRTPRDPWLSFDKVQHFTFSFLFTLGGQYTFENKFELRQAHALPLAVTGSFLIGLGKELYDWQRGPRRYFSYRDLVANGAGIIVATGFILL